LSYFLNDKGKKNKYTYIYIMFVTFVLIFKFILIYLLHVLFLLKIKGIFGKKNPTQKCWKGWFFDYYNCTLK